VGRVKRLIALVAAVVALVVSLFVGFVQADDTTFTLVCGGQTYTVVKPNQNAAVYTNGTLNFVTQVGGIAGSGKAPPNAVLCTLNGFGPFPFIITAA
jgi:hypothetical protein